MQSRSHAYPRWMPVIGLLLLAAWLAARWLSYDLPFVDEWWSIFKSGGDIYGPLAPWEVWSRIVTVDPGGMGAGYYIALGGWQALVGSTPLAVRAYSLLMGVLAVAVTYRMGARWFSPGVGLSAALVLATSAFFINFMHEARAYTQVALMAALAVWAYVALMRSARPRWPQAAALTLTLAGLAYSHYVALSVAGVIAVIHLAVGLRARTRVWWAASLAMVVGALLYVPWIPALLEVARRGAGDLNRQFDSMNAGQAIQTLLNAFSNGSPALMLVLLGAALIGVHARPGARSPLSSGAVVALWAVIGVGLALMVNALVPFLVHLRYLMFAWPALALAVGLGAEALRKRGVPALLILGVWGIVGAAQSLTLDFNRSLFGEIYRAPAAGLEAARDRLRDLVRPDDLLLFHFQQPGTTPFGLFIEDYLTRDLPEGLSHAQFELMNNSFAETDAEYRRDVETILGTHERVWTLRVPEVAQSQRSLVLRDALADSYANCGVVVSRPDAELALYRRMPDLTALRQRPPYQYGSEVTGRARMEIIPLRAIDDRAGGLASHSYVGVALGWSAGALLRDGRWSVAVHLVDAATDRVVQQDDYALPTTGYGCHVSVFDVPQAEGTYRVMVSVYAWETGERLPVTGYADGRIPLDTFVIAGT
ncbi:MAG: glycosyltransferase family 39 protein [Chloroflexi bacterium]|nr:glycosyltransferase family 39 protein [Chloroflexota bacterium]